MLGSAVLAESGVLECELEAPDASQRLALRVRNVNEALPVFSLPVGRIVQGKVSVELDENQIMQIRSAAICEVKGAGRAGTGSYQQPGSRRATLPAASRTAGP